MVVKVAGSNGFNGKSVGFGLSQRSWRAFGLFAHVKIASRIASRPDRLGY
jgi:hypothetical protein